MDAALRHLDSYALFVDQLPDWHETNELLQAASACTTLQLAHSSSLHNFSACTPLQLAHLFSLHISPACIFLQLADSSSLQISSACTPLQLAHLFSLHTSSACTSRQLAHLFQDSPEFYPFQPLALRKPPFIEQAKIVFLLLFRKKPVAKRRSRSQKRQAREQITETTKEIS